MSQQEKQTTIEKNTIKANDIFSRLLEKMIECFEKGVIVWQNPLKQQCRLQNINGRTYKGFFNYGILNLSILENGYQYPVFLTFKQCKEKHHSVKKGEKGTPIFFLSKIRKEDENGNEKIIRFLKVYTVFNVAQTTIIDSDQFKQEFEQNTADQQTENPYTFAADIVRNYEQSEGAPQIIYKNVGVNVYMTKADKIVVNPIENFISIERFYKTLFHEMAHSTGHKNRLQRPSFDGIVTDSEYAKEEIIAELTAAYLCGFAGIDIEKIVENSASYCDSWAKMLRENPKEMIFSSMKEAARASHYITKYTVKEDEE